MTRFPVLHILESIVKVNMELEESIVVAVHFWTELVEPGHKFVFLRTISLYYTPSHLSHAKNYLNIEMIIFIISS